MSPGPVSVVTNMQTQSVLETQRVMFAEIIRFYYFVCFILKSLIPVFSIADSIIEHQNDIKKKTFFRNGLLDEKMK